MNREVIGLSRCLDCGATIELRVNKNRKVYYFCDGGHDDKACNGSHKWGARRSRELIADAAREAAKPEPKPAPKPAPAAIPEPTTEPKGKANGSPERKSLYDLI